MDPLVKKLELFVIEHALFVKGSRLVAGVSGGPDSVALLHALHALSPGRDLELVAAHLNHGLRGTESDMDEEFVGRLCRELGVGFVSEKLSRPPSANLEDLARKARYRFLARTARDKGASAVAVGHHADDVAETLIINLIRGAGPSGLAAIPPSRELEPGIMLIRPLIGMSRDEIRAYLERSGLEWREDSSNLDPRFLRNRVRNELIPLMEKINPEVRAALVRAAQAAGIESEALRQFAALWLARHSAEGEERIELDIEALAKAPPGLRAAVLRESVRRTAGSLKKLSLAHVKDVEELVMKGPPHGSLDLPGVRAKRSYQRLAFYKADTAPRDRREETPQGPVELPVPGEVEWTGPGGVVHRISANLSEGAAEVGESDRALIRRDAIVGPLVVRSRKAGDRYRPSGFSGRRKLKDVMNELRVPPELRERWPVVACGEEIVWVPGMRPAEGCASTGDEEAVVLAVTPPLRREL